MKFIKYIIVFTLLLNYAYAGPPEYYFIPPLVESEELLNYRIKKYDNDAIFESSFLTIAYEKRTPKMITFLFNNYQRQQGIIPYATLSDREKQYFTTIFNVITDDEKKSSHIFSEFYKNHLTKHYKEKEKCTKEYCDFYSSITIDGLDIDAWGAVLPNSQYSPYIFQIVTIGYSRLK